MSETGNRFDYVFIEPKFLRADKSYQRDIDHARVDRIVKNYNQNLFNEPKVSKRDDGFYYIFDGDHSVAAHMMKFGKDTPIKCKVYYGLTPEEEMKLFVQQNGISKIPTRVEKLRALNNFNDPDVVDMVESARIAGVTINFLPEPARDKILAVDTAYSIYKRIGRTSFINMLCVIHGAWHGDAESYKSGMLKGFGYIFAHCEEQMKGISIKEMIASLAGYPISKLVERANLFQGNADRRYAQAIAEQYNKRKKTRRITLPDR